MDDTYVFQQIRRAGKNGIMFFGGLFLVTILLFLLNTRYFYNCFSGPFPITEDELAKIQKVSDASKYYVIVHGDSAEPIGYEEEGTGSDARIEATYILMGLKKHNLMIKSTKHIVKPEDTTIPSLSGPPYTLIGELKSIPKETEKEVLFRHIMQHGNGGRETLKFMLDDSAFVTGSWIAIFFGGMAVLWSLFSIIKSVGALKSPESHKAAKRLTRFGELNAVVRDIDAQVKSADAKKIGAVVWTKDWLLIPYPVDLKFTKIKDLVWAYKKITVHRVWFIPIYFSRELAIYDQNSDWYTLSIPGNQIDEFLVYAKTAAPWVTLGYDAGAAKKWPELAADARRRYEEWSVPKE